VHCTSCNIHIFTLEGIHKLSTKTKYKNKGEKKQKQINRGPQGKKNILKKFKNEEKNPQTKTTKSEDSSQFNLGWVWQLALVGFG